MGIWQRLCKVLDCQRYCPQSTPQPPPVVNGSFDPTIVLTVAPNTDSLGSYTIDALRAAMQEMIDIHFFPVWRLRANLVVDPTVKAGQWQIVFTNTADVADALGYHDLTPDGYPLGHVFVQTTRRAGEEVSVTASHELQEMLGDPSINLMAAPVVGDGALYAYETSDAVEETNWKIAGIPISNFVYPTWFEDFRAPNSIQFDHLHLVSKPFELLPGGYAITYKSGVWGQVFGSREKAARFAKEDRTMHRSWQRRIQEEYMHGVRIDGLLRSVY